MKKPVHLITYKEAIEFIKLFIDNSVLRGVAKNDALGGMIEKESINGVQALDYTGNMAWFCYNPYGLAQYSRLFLAFEKHSNYSPGQVVDEPDAKKLFCPTKSSIFTYDRGVDGNIKDFIEKQGSKKKLKTVDRTVSKSYVRQFKTNYHHISPQNNPNRLNIRPYGFFENGQSKEVEQFLCQKDIKYVRYFFGYSNAAGYDKSKIRVLLFGANSCGENLIPRNTSKVETGDQLILQKSWPPPVE